MAMDKVAISRCGHGPKWPWPVIAMGEMAMARDAHGRNGHGQGYPWAKWPWPGMPMDVMAMATTVTMGTGHFTMVTDILAMVKKVPWPWPSW